jgi:hypothetical protein
MKTLSCKFPFNLSIENVEIEVVEEPKDGKFKICLIDVQGVDPRMDCITAIIRRSWDFAENLDKGSTERFRGTGTLKIGDQSWNMEGLAIASINLGEEVYSLSAVSLDIEISWEYLSATAVVVKESVVENP